MSWLPVVIMLWLPCVTVLASLWFMPTVLSSSPVLSVAACRQFAYPSSDLARVPLARLWQSMRFSCFSSLVISPCVQVCSAVVLRICVTIGLPALPTGAIVKLAWKEHITGSSIVLGRKGITGPLLCWKQSYSLWPLVRYGWMLLCSYPSYCILCYGI